MKYFDSYEAERLKKLIAYKETYLQTLAKQNNKAAYQIIQAELMFLKVNILPIIQRNTNIIHAEFGNFATKCFDAALIAKCNGLLLYQPIEENYIDRPLIGVVNPRQNQQFGSFGAMDVSVDLINMDGMGAKVNPVNLILNELI